MDEPLYDLSKKTNKKLALSPKASNSPTQKNKKEQSGGYRGKKSKEEDNDSSDENSTVGNGENGSFKAEFPPLPTHDFSIDDPNNHYEFKEVYRWNTTKDEFVHSETNHIVLEGSHFGPSVCMNPDTFARDNRYEHQDNSKAIPVKIGVKGCYNNTPYYIGVLLVPFIPKGTNGHLLCDPKDFNKIAFFSGRKIKSETTGVTESTQEKDHFLYVIKPFANTSSAKEEIIFDGRKVVTSYMARTLSHTTYKDIVADTSRKCKNSNHYDVDINSVLFGCIKRTGCFPYDENTGKYEFDVKSEKFGDKMTKFVTVPGEYYEEGVANLKKSFKRFMPRLNMNHIAVEFVKIPQSGPAGNHVDPVNLNNTAAAVNIPDNVDISIDIDFTLVFPLKKH